MLNVLTCDENGKIRKTEIDSLMRTEVIEFYQHLNFFEINLEDRIKKNEAQKNKNGNR